MPQRLLTPRPAARFPLWLLPNLLSLDAPAVAVVWQRHLGAAFGVRVPVAASVGLAAITWAVYLADRVFDARAEVLPDTDRHRFAAAFSRTLSVLAMLSAVVGFGSALLLPLSYFLAGVWVAVGVAAYLLVVHLLPHAMAPRGRKELLVGLLFAAGVAVPLIAESGAVLDWLPAVVAFGLCCFWNCRLIDRWEQQRPTGRTTGRVIGATAAVISLASPLVVCAPLVAALLLLLLVDAVVPVVGTRVGRLLADAALLTPLPVWVFA